MEKILPCKFVNLQSCSSLLSCFGYFALIIFVIHFFLYFFFLIIHYTILKQKQSCKVANCKDDKPNIIPLLIYDFTFYLFNNYQCFSNT